MTADWPQSLLDASVFPHPVAGLQLVETHISWVLLTGDYAYKIKKPLDLGFLDFSTLEKRRHFCERELALNRRFSSDLYLEVVPITGTPGQPRIGGDGDVLDYAVKMRQFDNSRLAENLAGTGGLTDGLVRKMAATLAGYHRDLPAVEGPLAEGAADTLAGSAAQNFAQIREYPLDDRLRLMLDRCETWIVNTFSDARPLMDRRQLEGFIKDCHGDCHLGNIVVIDGEAILFDCIEFNDAFRVMDTIAEAAFLSMDLCARGLEEQSQQFLNAYLEYRGDYDALSLFNLYRCYYALVRAKVTLMNNPVEGHPPVNAEACEEATRYLALAERFTVDNSPVLILMHGLSGSGKSWLAERVAARSGAIRIRSDVERKRLFGLPPEPSGESAPGIYSREVSQRTFARLLELARTIIGAGFSCIVDATFLSARSRAPFLRWAERERIHCRILGCRAAEDTILRRLARRGVEAVDPSDADGAIYRLQKAHVDPFSAEEQGLLITVNTERENAVEAAIAGLSGGR